VPKKNRKRLKIPILKPKGQVKEDRFKKIRMLRKFYGKG
jgi:hypothetical protein